MTTSSQQLSWMRSFAIIQGSLFFDLKRIFQTRLDKQDCKPLKRLDKLTKFAEWHHFVMMFLHISSWIRCIPVILIRLGVFERLKPWDCFLVGRFSYLGRTSGYSPFMAVAFYQAFILYRHQLAKPKAGGPFRFYALEFMFYDYEELVKNEVQAEKTNHIGQVESLADSKVKVAHEEFIYAKHAWTKQPKDPVLYLENAFHSHQSDRFILRPNRTSSSWLLMAKYTRICLFLFVPATLGWIVFIHYAIAGNAMTKKGFELNYRACTVWLRQQQLQNPHYLSFIHQNNGTLASEINVDRLPFFVPLEDFVEMSVYSSVRIFFDLVENNLWYTDFWLVFGAMAYNGNLTCIDLIINSNEIKRELTDIVGRIRQTRHLLDQANHTPRLEKDKARIQAILLDHLVMVRGYNSYISFYLSMCIFVWFQESVIVCIWTGMARSRVVELDFAATEFVTFSVLMFLLSGPAISRRISSQLYRLVSNAAALDQVTASKRRWAIITKYFYPRSDYCFTLFDSIELSWLFCLKLLSWVISAVVVLANFFYMYHGRSK